MEYSAAIVLAITAQKLLERSKTSHPIALTPKMLLFGTSQSFHRSLYDKRASTFFPGETLTCASTRCCLSTFCKSPCRRRYLDWRYKYESGSALHATTSASTDTAW